MANFINSMFGYESMHALLKKYEIDFQNRAVIEEEESDIPEDVINKEKYEALNNMKKYEKTKRRSLMSEVEMENLSERGGIAELKSSSLQ